MTAPRTTGTAIADAPPSNAAVTETVSGTALDGATLTASDPSLENWGGAHHLTFSYQWRSCTSAHSNCSNVGPSTCSIA